MINSLEIFSGAGGLARVLKWRVLVIRLLLSGMEMLVKL